MRIYTKPMTVSARKNIYKDLDERQKEDVKSFVFLPEGAYPKTRGRPPKYDFLYVWVSDIDEDGADRVKKALWAKIDRRVFYYPKTRSNRDGTTESGYVFLLSWRSRKDGKALPNKLKFFEEIRNAVAEAAGGTDFSTYGKVPEGEAPEESAHAESVLEEEDIEISEGGIMATDSALDVPEASAREIAETLEEASEFPQEEASAENEREKEKIRKEIDALKRRKAELKKQLESVERMGKFMPTYKSKKKKITKELNEIRSRIGELESMLKVKSASMLSAERVTVLSEPTIGKLNIEDYVCKCQVCGYKRRLRPEDVISMKGDSPVVRAVCPICGSVCAVVYKPLQKTGED